MRSELADAEKKLGLCKTTLEEETREKELMKGQIRKLNEQINEYRMDGNRSKDI